MSKDLLIATAESCTGGLIAGALTEIPGSSAVFDRGFVTYSNEAKTDMLDVQSELIAAEGAVSAGVAEAMASGAIERSRANLAISVTGIAGPGGGAPDKPIGLVWFGAATVTRTKSYKRHFANEGRNEIRSNTVAAALEDLLDLIKNSSPN